MPDKYFLVKLYEFEKLFYQFLPSFKLSYQIHESASFHFVSVRYLFFVSFCVENTIIENVVSLFFDET